MAKKLLPFSWLPGHWGLSGKMRKLAQAEYELEGEILERERVEINMAEKTDKEKEVLLLALDHKYGRLTESEYEKKKATALEEPFVRVAKLVTDPAEPSYGSIIFDYNKTFVLYLEEHGYGPNPDDDETVNQWFNELCKNVAMEAFDGVGDFAERMGIQPQKQRKSSMSDDVLFSEDLKKDDGGLAE